MMSLRSELSARNDLTVPIQLQFFLLHDARQGVWNHLEQFDTTVEPNSEYAVPFEIVLNNMCYVRTRPVISNCREELPFSPLYRVQALCHRKLDPTEFGPSIEQAESNFIPQQPTGGAASAQSMTPRAAEEAALVDQVSTTIPCHLLLLLLLLLLLRTHFAKFFLFCDVLLLTVSTTCTYPDILVRPECRSKLLRLSCSIAFWTSAMMLLAHRSCRWSPRSGRRTSSPQS